jgi:hypothetical protein
LACRKLQRNINEARRSRNFIFVFAAFGGGSKIVQDVPPFMIADGNPAEIRGIAFESCPLMAACPNGDRIRQVQPSDQITASV